MSRLIVVDDDPISCDILRRFLERDGFEVCAVYTGQDALDAGESIEPQALITDWLLKGTLDGLDVARALHKKWPRMHVIFMTGLPEALLKSRSEDVHIAKILEKPFLANELVAYLHTILVPTSNAG